MEWTYEQWRQMKKDLHRKFSSVGWILILYYLIMNVSVYFCTYAEMIIKMMVQLSRGDLGGIMDLATESASSGWGYFLAAAVGILILLAWKKPRYWREQIWAKGRPMKVRDFFGILCVFLSGQAVYQIVTMLLELLLNCFGLSIIEGMSALSVDTDTFSMFLYAGILAPITEEILFRGLIQRTLLPYGKKFAIFCSAFCFGIFHGNLIQSPYAFLVGLVLGYVASEYSIAWAMVLHMINNLVIADMLPRLTSGLPEVAAGLVIWAVIAVCTIAAVVIAIVKRKQIGMWLRQERMNRTCLRCFFSSAGMIVLMAVMGLSMIATFILMVWLM